MDNISWPKSANKDGSSVAAKGCTNTLKEATYVVRAVTLKANQIKYYEANISCLYLINLFNLIQIFFFQKAKFNKEKNSR
jgi:hypothetical protein